MCYFSWCSFLGWFSLGPTLPVGILGWDPWAVLCSHQSWALRNSRECPSQRQRCPEDPQELGNRQHCELRLPDLNPAGHAGFVAYQRSCGLWRGPFCSRPVSLLTPRVHAYIRGYAVSGELETELLSSDRGAKAMGCYGILVHPSVSLLGAAFSAPPWNFCL